MRRIENLEHWIAPRGAGFHRISLGLLFVWFGLLKPFGVSTTTSILADTVYGIPPELAVPMLGWWEVAIGVALILPGFNRLALLLLLIRLPGTVLSLVLFPETCFVDFPFAPTPQGQYLIKDVVLFFATLAIAIPDDRIGVGNGPTEAPAPVGSGSGRN